MRTYILRRLLWMLPTLLGITLVVFFLTQLLPGSPIDQMVSQIYGVGSEMGARARDSGVEKEIERYRHLYGFDLPLHTQYLNWLCKVLQLDLGKSFSYDGRPVWDVIVSKMPISLFFGISSLILSYLVCIPLGVYKAIYNKSRFDTLSSLVIYAGYVIPSYALGVLLIIYFCGGRYFNIFPLSGVVSDEFDDLTWIQQVLDFAHHMALPLFCYMVGEFAVLTMLMKNSLMEEIRKDYVRTALVKGASMRRAIWAHAFRNSLVPLVTRLPELFTVMFAGAMLIEKVFDIDGMGLLAYNAVVGHDYPVVMGLILLTSILTLLGRLSADVVYALVDPRIRFS